MTLARERDLALGRMWIAARRLVLCEARYFKSAIRYSRAGRERARRRREYWRHNALEVADEVADLLADLARLGLAGSGLGVLEEAERAAYGYRRTYLACRGLDPRHADQLGLAVETIPGVGDVARD